MHTFKPGDIVYAITNGYEITAMRRLFFGVFYESWRDDRIRISPIHCLGHQTGLMPLADARRLAGHDLATQSPSSHFRFFVVAPNDFALIKYEDDLGAAITYMDPLGKFHPQDVERAIATVSPYLKRRYNHLDFITPPKL